MLQDGTANIVAACKANGVKRISVVTTIGAGDSMNQAPWAFRLLMMTVVQTRWSAKPAPTALLSASRERLRITRRVTQHTHAGRHARRAISAKCPAR